MKTIDKRSLADLERAAEQAQEAADAAWRAAEHAQVTAELAAEDLLAARKARQTDERGEDGEDYTVGQFAGRLADWLRSQPDVVDVEIVADGGNDTTASSTVLGFVLAGIGGVSLGMNPTP